MGGSSAAYFARASPTWDISPRGNSHGNKLRETMTCPLKGIVVTEATTLLEQVIVGEVVWGRMGQEIDQNNLSVPSLMEPKMALIIFILKRTVGTNKKKIFTMSTSNLKQN